MICKRTLGLLLVPVLAGACSFLPRNGPDETAILEKSSSHLQAEDATLGYNYVVVDVNREVIPFVTKDDSSSFSTFGASSAEVPSIRLGAGDVIQITIF
ncbi:hypothetical protein, partial [Leisingera sp. F5]